MNIQTNIKEILDRQCHNMEWININLCLGPMFDNLAFAIKSLQSILEEVSPTWMNVSLRMKDDPEADKAFGWVLEM